MNGPRAAVTSLASSRASSAPTGISVQSGTSGNDRPVQPMTCRSELAREDAGTDTAARKAVQTSSRASSAVPIARWFVGRVARVSRRLFAATLLSLGSLGIAHAAIDAYTFKDEAERARYAELTRELRCPKCQNQDIADSNAPIAADLRKEIYRMLGEGQSNQQIIDFMVDRYGEFVRYKPELNAHTWLLWFGPAGLLLGGVLLIGVIVARRRGQRAQDADVLSDEERQRLAHLLDKNHE